MTDEIRTRRFEMKKILPDGDYVTAAGVSSSVECERYMGKHRFFLFRFRTNKRRYGVVRQKCLFSNFKCFSTRQTASVLFRSILNDYCG